MAKFTHRKSKNKGVNYPIEFRFIVETEEDLRALYAYLKFPTKTVARFYNQSGRRKMSESVLALPKSCLFKKVSALCKERGLLFESKI